MVQSVLVFALGFLGAVLIALMVAPAIWRRAVYLTRKRIEASLPLTANELNAEKDKLRAEHALAVRRVEMQVRALREEVSAQKIFIEEKADKLRETEGRLAASLAEGQRLGDELNTLTNRFHEQTAQMSETTVLLESTRSELEMRTDELNAARQKLEDRARELEAMARELDEAARMAATERETAARQATADRAEISVRDAHIETLNATILELKDVRKDLQRQNHELTVEGRATGDMLKTERKRFAQVEAKLEQSIAKISVLEEKLERRGREMQRIREEGGATGADVQDMEARAIAAEKAQKAQEREIAEMTLRIDRLMTATFGEKEQEAMLEEMRAKMGQQTVEIRKLEAERDALKRELSDAIAGGNEAADAVLRDKLNQLAAEVIAMAARLEGPQSRVNTLLSDEAASSSGDVISLAERIKALQQTAGTQRGSA
ncbi:MAG: hypothetical protein WAU86_02450 [Oricola sp.]